MLETSFQIILLFSNALTESHVWLIESVSANQLSQLIGEGVNRQLSFWESRELQAL
jgi:hypothetical protein